MIKILLKLVLASSSVYVAVDGFSMNWKYREFGDVCREKKDCDTGEKCFTFDDATVECKEEDQACICGPENLLCTSIKGCPFKYACIGTRTTTGEMQGLCYPCLLLDTILNQDSTGLLTEIGDSNCSSKNDTNNPIDNDSAGNQTNNSTTNSGTGGEGTGNNPGNDSDTSGTNGETNNTSDNCKNQTIESKECEDITVHKNSSVCVDAKLLYHLSHDNLVFSSHQRSSVLCDSFGSCATPGHIVVFEKQAMMMKSYCGLVSNCSYRIMEVNSPKMKIGLKVLTKSPSLKFTAFSAVYESRIEEIFLSHVVNIGI